MKVRNFLTDFVSRPVGNTVEYQLDPIIALRVKQLRLGLDGCRKHSWRALAIRVTGYEDQMTGSNLERLACWTLNEGCWCERCGEADAAKSPAGAEGEG